MPFFSVIIPNYNHGIFLKERIESIINQTFRDFEIMILDDDSTDESRRIIEAYRQEVKIISYNSSNSGSPFSQWKKGLDLASGEWIWIAESDDFSDIRFLKEAVQSIKKNPTIGLFYCDSYWLRESADSVHEKFSNNKNDFFESSKWSSPYLKNGIEELNECLKFFCTINNASCMVFKKEIAFSCLKDLQSYRYHGDWLFYIKMSKNTDFYYLAKPLNYFRDHKSSHFTSINALVRSKEEHFKILSFLHSDNAVSEKQKVIKVFANYHLGFGILEDGLGTILKIVRVYLNINRTLTLKVLWQIFLTKLFRRRIKERHF